MNKKTIKTVTELALGLGIITTIPAIITSCNNVKPEQDPVWTFKNEHIGGVGDNYIVDVVQGADDDHMNVNLRYNIPDLESHFNEWASITFYVNGKIFIQYDPEFSIRCVNQHPNDWMWNSYQRNMYFVTEITDLIQIPEQFSVEFQFELFSQTQQKKWYKYLDVNVSKYTE